MALSISVKMRTFSYKTVIKGKLLLFLRFSDQIFAATLYYNLCHRIFDPESLISPTLDSVVGTALKVSDMHTRFKSSSTMCYTHHPFHGIEFVILTEGYNCVSIFILYCFSLSSSFLLICLPPIPLLSSLSPLHPSPLHPL